MLLWSLMLGSREKEGVNSGDRWIGRGEMCGERDARMRRKSGECGGGMRGECVEEWEGINWVLRLSLYVIFLGGCHVLGGFDVRVGTLVCCYSIVCLFRCLCVCGCFCSSFIHSFFISFATLTRLVPSPRPFPSGYLF